ALLKQEDKSQSSASSRRKFLRNMSSVTAATIGLSMGAPATFAAPQSDDLFDIVADEAADAAANRCKKSYKFRVKIAQMARDRALVAHTSNGDLERYANKIAVYSKALPHNNLGEVDLAAYATLAKAVQTQEPSDFEAIKLGLGRKL